MFDVDMLIKNQQKWMLYVYEVDGNADNFDGIRALTRNYPIESPGKITDMDNFITEIFTDFPLQESSNLVLRSIKEPIGNIDDLDIQIDATEPVMLTARFINNATNFVEHYQNDIISRIQTGLQKLPSNSIYVFGMRLPFYSMFADGRLAASFGSKIIPR